MRSHRGIRPHDIIVLLKLTDGREYRQIDLSNALYMSQSEISDSLGRSQFAGLLNANNKSVYINNLMEFLKYGIKYTFPVVPGRKTRGMATGHSAPPLREEIVSDTVYVWPYHKGDLMGESITPLHKSQHLAAMHDTVLYQKLALVDAIRLKNPREVELAINFLNEMIVYA